MARAINERLESGKFHFEPDETHEDILRRTELLRAAAEDLPALTEGLVTRFRQILSETGITPAHTGKLSCLLVGGNIHQESSLKSWSDFDLVIAAEKPFAPARTVKSEFLPISWSMRHAMGKALWSHFEDVLAPQLNQSLSHRLSRPVNVLDLESPEGGLVQIMGWGDQRKEDVQDSLLLFEER